MTAECATPPCGCPWATKYCDENHGPYTPGNPDCTDARPGERWSCVEFDGTGMWCESCLAFVGLPASALPAPAREYRHEDLDPSFVLWMAWAKDVYDENKEAGMDMLIGYVAKVIAEARRPAVSA